MALESIPRRRRRRTTDDVVRVIAYLRVSTDEQAESRAGLEAQRAALQRELDSRGWTEVRWLTDAGFSGKNLDRPAMTEALRLLETGETNVLLAAKLDRLSRSVQDFANLSDMARTQGWALRILDLGLDMTSPEGEMMAGVLSVFAQFERRLIGQRTRSGMAARKAQGHRIGGKPSTIPLHTRTYVKALRSDGMTYAALAEKLNAEGVEGPRGNRWYPMSVSRVVAE